MRLLCDSCFWNDKETIEWLIKNGYYDDDLKVLCRVDQHVDDDPYPHFFEEDDLLDRECETYKKQQQ